MKPLFIQLFVLFLFPNDVINTGQDQYYGKITSFNNNKVVFNSECSGEYKQIEWKTDFYIEFNELCHHPEWTMSQNPSTADMQCEKATIFYVKFKNIDQASVASSLSCNNGIVTISFYNNRGSKSYYLTGIESIAKRYECTQYISTDFPIP